MHRANQCPSHSHGNRVAQLTAGAAIVVAPAAAAAAAPAAAIGPGADAALARRVAAASAERLRDRSWVFGFFFLFSFTFVCDEKRFVFVLTQLPRPVAPPTIDGFVCSANVALRANLLQFLIVSERVRR